MTTLVVYESTFGNTARIAEAIAARLGARMLPVSEARPLDLEGADLLLIGGPTQTHGVPPALRELLDTLEGRSLVGVRAAAFDTRLDRARLLTGAASDGLMKRLKRKGATVVAPGGSFLVGGSEGPLLEGELERALGWAVAAAAKAEPVAVNGAAADPHLSAEDREITHPYPLPPVGVTYRQDAKPRASDHSVDPPSPDDAPEGLA